MIRTTPAQALLQEQVVRALHLRPGASPGFLSSVAAARRQAVDEAIHQMLSTGRIVDRGSGRYHAYYLVNSGAGPSTTLRGAALGLLNRILRGDGATFADLVTETGLSKSEVSRLGSRLAEAGVIEPMKVAGTLFYLPVNQGN